MHFLIGLLVSAIGLLVAAYLLPGIEVADFTSALWAAFVIAVLNVTLGWLLSLVIFPLTWLLPNLIYFLIDALMIYFAGRILKGFRVKDYTSALLAALVLTVLHFLLGA